MGDHSHAYDDSATRHDYMTGAPHLPLRRDVRDENLDRRAVQEVAWRSVTEGKYKEQPAYIALRDVKYMEWVLNKREVQQGDETTEDSDDRATPMGVGPWTGVQETMTWPWITLRRSPELRVTSWPSWTLSAILPAMEASGLRSTCKSLGRILDSGGGFKGIGGIAKTAGARQLQLCLELAEGGLAHGDLGSVVLVDSSTPLFLSLERSWT